MNKTLKVDGIFGTGTDQQLADTGQIIAQAQQLEEIGYDGVMIAEINHDPFLPFALAAHHTSRLELRTAIAVALARNPMNLANLGHDLNAYSRGRFTLGIGSQIKPHITKRWSMPWGGPARQMREFIESLHAIWDCWYEGKPLLYEGEHYNYRLMTPEFTPENQEYGRPEVMLAAVGPLMQKTAAAVADGMIIHPFCTEKYLKEEMLPSLEQELAQNGKSLENFKIQYPVFIATGETEEQLHTSKEAIRYRIGYYASTPSYKGVLDVHGWGEIQPILNRLTKEGKWDELSSHVTDEMLETFAAVGTPTEAAQIIKDRFGGYIDRVKVEPDYAPEVLEQQLAILRG